MTTAESSSAVMALVVEDDEEALGTRLGLLEAHGITALGARSAQDALREFRASPGVDIVVTDINLDPLRRKDTSGVALARAIRRVSRDVPIVGYSAAFSEGDLPAGDWEVFDSYFPKGQSEPGQITARVEDWRKKALEHRVARTSRAREELERLREKYPSVVSEFSTLRFLVPTRSAGLETATSQSVDELLRLAGYRLRLIERGGPRPQLEDGEGRLSAPIMFWLKDVDDTVIAEAYGYPELYSYGENDDEAIRNVLLLMDGFYRDLGSDPNPSSATTKRLLEFLVHVFG
jgi:CheY-like chemotaxis protein